MWRFFAECFCFVGCFFSSLPSVLFSALGKDIGMSSAVVLPSVVSDALGKQFFCRVPDEMHLANILALGKSPVSGSELRVEIRKSRMSQQQHLYH